MKEKKEAVAIKRPFVGGGGIKISTSKETEE